MIIISFVRKRRKIEKSRTKRIIEWQLNLILNVLVECILFLLVMTPFFPSDGKDFFLTSDCDYKPFKKVHIEGAGGC